jgi:hypothetical protein
LLFCFCFSYISIFVTTVGDPPTVFTKKSLYVITLVKINMELTYIVHHNREVPWRAELLLTNGNERKPYAKIMLSQQLSPVHVTKPQASPRIKLYRFNN